MTVNAVAFYLVALLIVAAALAAVVLPRLREAGTAAIAVSALVAILCLSTGAYAVGVVQFVIAAVLVLVAQLVIVRREPYCRIAASTPPTTKAWWLAAAVATGFGLLIIIPFALSADVWHAGSGSASLTSLLGERAPYALVIGAIYAVAVTGIALLVGRTGEDERELDRALDARRQREERMRRRREDRAAARRREPANAAEVQE